MSALFRARTFDFDGLYRKHAPSVYRYAYAVLGNQSDAEDVTQQTFLNAYRAIEQGTKPRKAENWLIRIAHNEVRRHFRKNGGSVEVEFDDQVADAEVEPVDPSLADVLRGLRKLPPMQREALVMREFEGRSYAEIAEILGVTQSALEALIFRARRSLAAELEEALNCTEAEHAISRRLDGRLRRRESRRLKEHLHECVKCVRFATLQKRQQSLLKGLSIMPIPASLFLFRGEHAAAATGLGGGAAAAAGPVLVGGGAGATVIAKAAVVTAAVAVTGGVGYGVATEPAQRPDAQAKVARVAVAPRARPFTGARAAAPATARPEPAERVLPTAVGKRQKLKLRTFKVPRTKPAAKPAEPTRGKVDAEDALKPESPRAVPKPHPAKATVEKESGKIKEPRPQRAKRAAPVRRPEPRTKADPPAPGRMKERPTPPPRAEQPVPPPTPPLPLPAVQPPPKKTKA